MAYTIHKSRNIFLNNLFYIKINRISWIRDEWWQREREGISLTRDLNFNYKIINRRSRQSPGASKIEFFNHSTSQNRPRLHGRILIGFRSLRFHTPFNLCWFEWYWYHKGSIVEANVLYCEPPTSSIANENQIYEN